MSEFIRLPLTYLLLVICSFTPGFFFVRRLKWNYLETACASLALSHLLVYLVSTAVFLLHLSPICYYCFSATAVALGIASRTDLRQYFARREVQQLFAWFGVLLVWGLIILSLVRTYSGGFWAGDYWEHFQRAQFFLHWYPTDFQFLGLCPLPARPPFMNVVIAFFLGQVGESFPAYQVISQFLNLHIYFALVLMAGLMVRGGHRQVALVVTLLALCPAFQQNQLFPWTKLFCCFYTLLGLAFYIRGWRKHDSHRMLASVACLACAALIHYSSGPYLLFLAIHYLTLVIRGTRASWEPVAAGAIVGIILATWFSWSLAFYGPGITFGDNPTVTASAQLSLEENVQKVAQNTIRSLVPHPVYLPRATFNEFFWQPSQLGYVREYWFLIYQTTLFPMMGLAGGLIVIHLVTRDLQTHQKVPRPLQIFWAAFIPFCILIGIAVNGGQELVGMAHVCLQPLAFLGVVYLAASFGTLPAWVRRATVLAAGFDAAVGIVLHVHMLRFSLDLSPDGRLVLSKHLPSVSAIANGLAKVQYPAAFVGDLAVEVATVLMVSVVAGVICFLWILGRAAESSRNTRAAYPGWAFVVAVAIVGVVGFKSVSDTDWSRTEDRSRPVQNSPAESHLEKALRCYSAADLHGARTEIGIARTLAPSDPEVDYYFRVWSVLHEW